MIYLLSQMSLIIILSAIAGGAIGWALQRVKGQQRVEELHAAITHEQRQVKQSQTEVSMLSQDYDELKQSSAATIETLRQENREIPNLHQNLEKSQLLVRQLMQKHEAQIREYASENEILKGKIKHLDDRERALNKLQADVEQGRREINKARKNDTDSGDSVGRATVPTDANTGPSGDTLSNATTSTTTALSHTPAQSGAQTSDASVNHAANATDTESTRPAARTDADTNGKVSDSAGVENRDTPSTDTHAVAPSGLVPPGRTNTTSQSIAELTAIARQRAKQDKNDGLDLSADVSGEAGSLTVALAEADVVLAAIDKKREAAQQVIADDEVIDASDIDPDMEFGDEAVGIGASERLFDPVDQHDDLQTIFGIGPVTERGLNRLGITSYSQLADLKRHDIERIANALEIVPGKIERENWVGNARRQLEDVLEEL